MSTTVTCHCHEYHCPVSLLWVPLSLVTLTGLMISGFACAARALGREEYTKVALEAAGFVRSTLFNADEGTLLRSAYRDERG